MKREIEIRVELSGRLELVGRLWPHLQQGRESASFEYNRAWLESPARFALEPLLLLDGSAHHTPPGRSLFGALGDSAPDCWGRMLLRRAERRRAARDGQAPRTLWEIDCLLLVDDRLRQGALRFKETGSDIFLADQKPRVPLLVELPQLLSASNHVLTEQDTEEDLRLLLAPGSSLGGARPKAAVRDTDGSLAVAKFPHSGDEYSIEIWSCLALNLARRAGLTVPSHRLVTISGQPVLLVRRFDREGKRRLPFLSALSMLGARDNEEHSYLELVDAIRRHGTTAGQDLTELWRRLLFNVLVSNFDDHLRNHGFLYDEAQKGWRLSPVYDLNSVPADIKPRFLSLLVDEADNAARFALVLEVGEYFGLDLAEMRESTGSIVEAVKEWRKEAVALGQSAETIERLASAFEHGELEAAKAFMNRF